ncbi:MAG: hypothetical protein A3C35_00870 [Omnitrophica bacterium RIFCSPHIGHO2_02_FULL_46_11]|nr:MAG: hypothetical protein A3C35_00870 [Omnitrophica bacterium RIFCSPHIGHO2_02_FULL_46_11]OGW86801.1 MAG: hypothetical protein A3A81_04030 [Omnitrophica bacterium RIFCSPLOWO2_01_FULL_45_10b]
MKKFIAILLVLVVCAPAITNACDCCPSASLNSSQSVYEKSSHQCCSVLDVQKDSCRIQKVTKFLPASQGIFISPLFLMAKFVSIPISVNFAVREFEPPGFSSHTPIYLAGRTLRI